MGCMPSKIENEETVTRCKERKQLMKEAVAARAAFAAAHSAYVTSLKNTGAALTDYAQGESAAASSSTSLPAATVQLHYGTLPPPPPPPPPPFRTFLSSPLYRAATMPQISTLNLSHTTIEEEDEEEIENETNGLKHRSSRSSGDGGISSGVGPSLVEVDEGGSVMEEIKRKAFKERSKRADGVDGGYGGGARSMEAEVAEEAAELPHQPMATSVKKVKPVAPAPGKRGGRNVASINLLQIFSELDDCFLMASESAQEVSKMIQANRVHYQSNFADNRGHIDHSARVMRAITWNTSFRGLPNDDDGIDDFNSEEHETHATVLETMLAWEKKLYDEVKNDEQMKLEYQRKVASLNKLKKHGGSAESIQKTKAKVSRLHTRYIVDMQSMDSTVSEINRLRDEQLYPKLVALVHGMATMWESMKEQHENQKNIAKALRFVDISQSQKETTDHHHQRTVQLWAVVQGWHSRFEKLTTLRKTYIKTLNNWLRLNLIPIDTNLKEKVSSPQRTQTPPIHTLLHDWHDSLEKLPDEIARTSISNFAAAVSTMVQCQVDEMKLRDKCDETRKELTRKTRQFEDWRKKFMEQRTPTDEADEERTQDKDLVAERKLPVEAVKQRLEEEEEVYQRQCVRVREKSLTTLKIQLPELFRVMYNFSVSSSKMYKELMGSISQSHKP